MNMASRSKSARFGDAAREKYNKWTQEKTDEASSWYVHALVLRG